MDKNFDNNEKEDSYGILSETLNGLKDNQYEIIPQNMAPFPGTLVAKGFKIF